MENHQDQIIRDAQYRKGLSIAFFNATNAAISLVAERQVPGEEVLKEVVRVRDFFLEEHKIYYANVIANIGLFNPADTIKRLQTAKSLEELRSTWIALSEDERQHDEVIKVKNEIKTKYEQK